MQRYNIFFPVHKGLRALLYETAIKLQQTCFDNDAEAAAAIDRLKIVIAIFESHAHKEDDYLFASIAEYEPAIIDAFAQEHKQDHALCENLQKSMATFDAADAANKLAMGEEIMKAFTWFMVFNLTHMAKEEQVINPVLWRYYTDAQLRQITQQIMKSVPQQETAFVSKWMMRGLNNDEVLYWMHGVKDTAPQPAFEALLAVAEKELHPQRWSRVKGALAESELVA